MFLAIYPCFYFCCPVYISTFREVKDKEDLLSHKGTLYLSFFMLMSLIIRIFLTDLQLTDRKILMIFRFNTTLRRESGYLFTLFYGDNHSFALLSFLAIEKYYPVYKRFAVFSL